jgi:hypothetical protein
MAPNEKPEPPELTEREAEEMEPASAWDEVAYPAQGSPGRGEEMD